MNVPRGSCLSSPWAGLVLAGALTLSTQAAADAVAPAPQRASPPSREWFSDLTGAQRDFTLEYRSWRTENRYQPDYGLAAMEVMLLVGIGTAQYWWSSSSNSADWDFPTLQDRLTLRAVRFDNNTFTTNHLLHPLAGLGYHAFSRASGLGLPAAIFYTEAASLLWEGALEWREKVSFNDLVFTSVGGIAMGEFTFHLGDYLNSATSPGLGHEIAQWTFGFPVRFNRMPAAATSAQLPPDSLGLSSAYWHRFVAQYEVSMHDNEVAKHDVLHGVSLAAELVSMPGFLRPGHFDVLFADGNFSEAQGRMTFGNGPGLNEADVWVSSCFAGYYSQNFTLRAGGLHGAAGMVGVGTALRYLDKNILGRPDQIATGHFLGPHWGVWLARGGLALRLLGDLHADFAAIRALPVEQLRSADPEGALPSVFEHDYQFHLGASGRLKLEVGYGPVLARVRGSLGSYESIEGFDRQEEEVTRHTEGSEILREYGVGIVVEPRDSPLHFELMHEEYWRRSRLNQFSEQRRDRRLTTSLGVVF